MTFGLVLESELPLPLDMHLVLPKSRASSSPPTLPPSTGIGLRSADLQFRPNFLDELSDVRQVPFQHVAHDVHIDRRIAVH